MNALTTLYTALGSLSSNKLRAGLTLLGIVIGVGSVIALMAIGRGAEESVTQRIADLGTNLLFVRPGAQQQGGFFRGLGTATTLTLDDTVAMDDDLFVPDIVAVSPELQASGQLVGGGNNTFTPILGVTSNYLDVRNFEIGSGRGVSPADVINRSEVIVLGSLVSDTLFEGIDPVGATVRIDGREFTVIGVLESKGGTGFANQDNQALVPLTTAFFRLSGTRSSGGGITVSSINVQVRNADVQPAAIGQLTTLLRLRHELGADEEDDFNITSQQDTIETLADTTDTFVIFLAAIASISLFVGGIGIMNIMLVSVTERTREIGIRRAVGAKRRDIMLQFVTEATLLSIGGGILGIALGSGIAAALDGRTIGDAELATVLTTDVAFIALGVSAAIGLFFGIYPAARAAGLDPILALRHE